MAGFGSNPTTSTEAPLATDQIYLSSVATPNTANGDLTALEGGPISTDSNSNKTAPASVWVKDGGDVTQGLKADTASTDATSSNTKMSFLKGLIKIWADIWDSTNHRVRVDGSGVTQPVTGSVSVNTISNYAAESGGNLDSIDTTVAAIKTDSDTLVTNTTGLATQATLSAVKTDLDSIKTDADTLVTNTTGLATQATLALAKTDLDSIATNTTGLATQTTLASILTNLALGQKTKSASLPFTLASDQGDIPVKGDFTEQASLTAGSLNADLVPSTDVSAYKWFSIHTNTNAFVGTMTIQGSNDNANWVSILANQPNNAGALSASITATNTLYVGIVAYRFLRVRMTAYTSGTAQATLELYTSSSSLITMGATQQGTWTVQPGNTANTTPWLVNASQIGGQAPKLDNTNELGVSLYGKNAAAGDTPIKVNSSGDQYVLGDFTEQAALSAGSLNADLVASTDVSAYKWLSIQLNSNAYVGTLSFQCSNDNATWNSLNLSQSGASSYVSTTAINGAMYNGPVFFRYLRIRMTAYTSGTAQATLELYTNQTMTNYIGIGSNGSSVSQSGTWTVQPGNTPNTTPWLESIHDGTNKANVLAATSVSNAIGSQGALLTGGAFAEQASLTAGSLNADLVPSTDVSNYKWLSLHINSSAYSGTLTFQGSNDNANWSSITLVDTSNPTTGSAQSTTSVSKVWHGPIGFRYLRIRMTIYTSGTAQATLELYTSTGFMHCLGVIAGQSGSWSVGPGTDLTLIASSAQTTTQTTADQTNNSGKGIRVVLDMTNVGTGSVTLEIDAKDVASGKYIALLTGAAVITNSTNVYVVYPGLTPAANAIVSDVLPKTWRVKVTANNANTATYSVGASYLT